MGLELQIIKELNDAFPTSVPLNMPHEDALKAGSELIALYPDNVVRLLPTVLKTWLSIEIDDKHDVLLHYLIDYLDFRGTNNSYPRAVQGVFTPDLSISDKKEVLDRLNSQQRVIIAKCIHLWSQREFLESEREYLADVATFWQKSASDGPTEFG